MSLKFGERAFSVAGPAAWNNLSGGRHLHNGAASAPHSSRLGLKLFSLSFITFQDRLLVFCRVTIEPCDTTFHLTRLVASTPLGPADYKILGVRMCSSACMKQRFVASMTHENARCNAELGVIDAEINQ